MEDITMTLENMRRIPFSEGLNFAYRRMWLHEWQGMYVVTGIGCCTDDIIKIPATIRTDFGLGEKHLLRDIRVGKVGERAFFRNAGLKGAVLTKVTEIGEEAFADCRSLGWVYLPKSLSRVGRSAFSGCGNLRAVFYEGTEEQFRKIRQTSPKYKSTDSTLCGGTGGNSTLCGGAPLNVKIYFNNRM